MSCIFCCLVNYSKYFSEISKIMSKSVVDEDCTVLLMNFIDEAFNLRRESLKVAS